MAEQLQLYVGTIQGIFTTSSDGSIWSPPQVTLPEVFSRGVVGGSRRPQRVFVAAGKDGLFRTEDAGRSWKQVLGGHVRAVAIDPSDDDVVYAGTEPVEIYRSADGGGTWEELAALTQLPEEVRARWWFPTPPHIGHVLHIFVHPDDSDQLYLSIEHGGIARSLDRGTTWEDVSEGIDHLDIHMVATLPHRFDRYYVATAEGFFTTADPAEGWARSEQGFTRDYFHDFIFLPPTRADDPPAMLISTADKNPGNWNRPEHARGAVFRSLDCGASWHWVGKGLPEEMPENVWAICNHPSDPNAAFVGLGRARTPGSTAPGTVAVTRDRGDSWERLALDLPLVLSLWPTPS